jgi:hypothetical protein
MDSTSATTLCLGQGNRKVGRILTFSLPSLVTCPGASAWCREHCYARRIERLRPNCRRAYTRNLKLSLDSDQFITSLLFSLPATTRALRIHVGGDFYSREYCEAWYRICQLRPRTRFYAYTRSWTLPKLSESLDELKSLANTSIFASTDPGMPLPPLHWRMAFVQNDPRANGLPCPHQQGEVHSCLDCGYCFNGEGGNVVFKIH